ncbi:MAG: M20/M25/M40 family metallo-hydrolase [Acidobacteriota bacterium]|nr:M20/M25/M40 family metallo-hydrolase [Acidobacteriota bacterium]
MARFPLPLAVCALLGAVSVAALAQPATTQLPDADRRLAREILKEMVEIKSGYTTGATTPVAQAAAARLRAAGFPEADIFVGGPAAHKFNLVARLHGAGAHKPLLLLAHTDVVEAKPEDWSPGLDPFTFNEQDGFFYGRGTSDDKGQAASWLEILIRMKREGFVPDRDIILALTADEEGGGVNNGIQWLLARHRDLIDAGLALNEGGYGEVSRGKKISNDLNASEKYIINVRLEVRNKGGHSSLPVPDNAIYHLAGALSRIGDFGFPLKTNETTAAYFRQMQHIESGPAGQALEGFDPASKVALQRAAAGTPTWNAMLRTTCVATQVEAGHARNALPQLASANINCRVLPEDSVEYVLATLKRVVADDKVSLSLAEEVTKGPASSLAPKATPPGEPSILLATAAVTERLWPGVPVVPTMVPYGTDGRFLRAAGIPSYGVQGYFQDREDIRWHGRDERLPVTAFYEGTEFLYELVKTLASPPR